MFPYVSLTDSVQSSLFVEADADMGKLAIELLASNGPDLAVSNIGVVQLGCGIEIAIAFEAAALIEQSELIRAS